MESKLKMNLTDCCLYTDLKVYATNRSSQKTNFRIDGEFQLILYFNKDCNKIIMNWTKENITNDYMSTIIDICEDNLSLSVLHCKSDDFAIAEFAKLRLDAFKNIKTIRLVSNNKIDGDNLNDTINILSNFYDSCGGTIDVIKKPEEDEIPF